MTGENRLEGNNPLGIRLLDTSQESSIPSNFVAGGDNTRVVTGGIAVPDIDVDLRNGKAGRDVDVLNFEVERNSGLTFSDVLSDEFASDVVRTVCVFGSENT